MPLLTDIVADARGLLSMTWTADEVSAVLPVEHVPAGVRVEAPFSVFIIDGTLAFSLVGVLHALTAPLADAGIPVFALSTFRTDYLLVPAVSTADAAAAWRAAGHRVIDADVAPG